MIFEVGKYESRQTLDPISLQRDNARFRWILNRGPALLYHEKLENFLRKL